MTAVLREGINHNLGAYVPGWLAHGDVGDLLGEVAPRAFLALNGAADRIFPVDGLHDTYAVARPAYAAAGCAERLDLGIYPGGHGFTDEMRSRAQPAADVGDVVGAHSGLEERLVLLLLCRVRRGVPVQAFARLRLRDACAGSGQRQGGQKSGAVKGTHALPCRRHPGRLKKRSC